MEDTINLNELIDQVNDIEAANLSRHLSRARELAAKAQTKRAKLRANSIIKLIEERIQGKGFKIPN